MRTRLRNNQKEIKRLMNDYEIFGATIVSGQDIADMDDWLVNERPKRRAPLVHSPDPMDNTQTTDPSTQPSQPSIGDSQISDAASEALGNPEFSDDYTGSSDDNEDGERSVNTDSGLPDTQASDSPYLSRADKKKRKKKLKKAKKKAKKSAKQEGENRAKRTRDPYGSPSY